MAKGKHSVALFEVIQAGKSSRRANLMRTPKWWFKGKKTESSSPAAPPSAPAPSALPAPVTALPVVADDVTAPAPRTPGVDLLLDPDRKRIKFDVSYNSAIVAAFAVVVVVGLAYVIGSNMTRGPVTAMGGTSTNAVLAGPAQPGVMKVGTNNPIVPPINANPKTERTETVITPPKPSNSTPPAPAPIPSPEAAKQRVAGLNYTVIQSFPTAEKAMAFEVADYLTKNGVSCSVASNLSDYRDLMVVVGLDGFQRISDKNYLDYEQRIRELSDKFVKETKTKNVKFMRFDRPRARQWKGTEKAVTVD